MSRSMFASLILGATTSLFATTSQATPRGHVLLDQNFENATGFQNDGADVNIKRQINDVYSNAKYGMKFAQRFTVEVLNISGSRRGSGSAAFRGDGYLDPDGKGGNFVIAMLSDFQDDRLGMSFDIGDRAFLNLGLVISAIDLTPGYFGGPLMKYGVAPKFRLTLWDNPNGQRRVQGSRKLAETVIKGQPSTRSEFVWTEHLEALSAADATNGKVILEIDLLEGGYAAFDNLRVVASDIEGDLAPGREIVDGSVALSPPRLLLNRSKHRDIDECPRTCSSDF